MPEALLNYMRTFSIMLTRRQRPKLREALIRDFRNTDIDALGTQALRSLETNWSRDAVSSIGLSLATIDVVELIDSQARSLEFWKLNPSFFTKYPSYRKCF